MTRHTGRVWLGLVIGAAVWSAACASPPNEARQAAEQQIQEARDAEVDVYAQDEFQAVMEEWDRAEQHMQAQEYGEARTGYEKVMELVAVAAREAEVGRQTMKIDVNQRKTEFQNLWKEVSAAIENTRGRAGRELAQEAKTWVEQINQQLVELEDNEKYAQMLTALDEATDKAIEFRERAAGTR